MNRKTKLRAGQWVEIRSKEEILNTLDKRGELESLPFMPEMLQYCGRRFRVSKRAHKTCDPANNGIQGRRMLGTVHLDDLRCDGQAHGGCEAGCLIFWKEAWLKSVSDDAKSPADSHDVPGSAGSNGCNEQDVLAGAYAPGTQTDSADPTYQCQSTRLSAATQPLRWWDLRQYAEDYASGNVKLSEMVAAFLFFIYHTLVGAGLGLGSALRWAYDVFQAVRGGTPYPWRSGKIPAGKRTPVERLDVHAGELVKVKDYREILETLDHEWKNRGMYFDAEMVPFCNGTYRVLKPVRQILDEKTGKMMRFKNDAIILENVVCQARYATCRRFCPRAIYPYWREIWLERVGDPGSNTVETKADKPSR